MLNAIIIDDEPLAADLLDGYISQVSILNLLGKFTKAEDALNFLSGSQQQDIRLDVIFLDIDMPGINGIQFAKFLPANTAIVFTTAHSQYAVQSYDHNTIDYLLKPISFDRFLVTINKLMKLKPGQSRELDDIIFIKSGKKILNLKLSNVKYVAAAKDYVEFVTDSQKILINSTMKEITASLPATFVRVHHSYIANMLHVSKIEENDLLIGNETIPVSAKYKPLLMDFLNRKSL